MKLGDILGKVAPWLAAAATGPAGLAGMAVKTIAEAVGAKASTTEALVSAVAGATPEQLTNLRRADQEFEIRMRELGFREVTELEALAAGDRKDARAMQIASRSLVPSVLTAFLVGSFIGTLVALFLVEVPVSNRDILVYMVGQLSGFTAAAIAFWLGTTRNSQVKTDIIAHSDPVKQLTSAEVREAGGR